MAVELSPEVKEMIDEPNMASLATIMADGSPHVSTMWVGRRDNMLIMNTVEGRVKTENMLRDPRISVSVYRKDSPYQSLHIRARVTNITPEGGNEGIDELSRKYLGKDYPWLKPGDIRLVVEIEPESVATMGI